MAKPPFPDVIVYVCCNCISQGRRWPRRWRVNGVQVGFRSVPCSGKMDARYLMHALEGGARGLCVVACPKGECTLAQGNYRAEVRIRTVQRLLGEVGLEPQRIELLYCSSDDPADRFEQLVGDAVGRICALGDTPIRMERKHEQRENAPAPTN